MPHEMFQKSEELFSLIEDGIDAGVYIFMGDMEEDYTRISKNLMRDFGISEQYIYQFHKDWAPRIYPKDLPKFNDAFSKVMNNETDVHICEYRAKNREGNYVWLRCKGEVIRKDEKIYMFAGCITNLSYSGKYDATTSLLNIRMFHKELTRLTQAKENFAILGINIHNFSSYNERYTHVFGDKLLNVFSQEVISAKDNNRQLFRLNGDRFAIIIPEGTAEDAKRCFDKVQNIAHNKCFVDNHQVNFSVRGGALVGALETWTADAIYRNLETILSEAKNNEREELLYFDDDMLKKSQRRIQLVEDLRNSIRYSYKGFSLVYQPVFHRDTYVGCEALLRFHSDTLGDIEPEEFIPILETEANIIHVSKWVLHMGLHQLEKWQKTYPNLYMGFNISYMQIIQENFIKEVLDIIDQYQITDNAIYFELTENCKLLDVNHLCKIVDELKNNGITPALSNFGSGYASMEILRYLDVDLIKLDRHFVGTIMDNEIDISYLEYITELCKELNVKVCAEGIETYDVNEIITKYNPEYVQGYLYGKPCPPHIIEKEFIYK